MSSNNQNVKGNPLIRPKKRVQKGNIAFDKG